MSFDKNVKAAMARSFKRQAKEQEKEDKRRENERKEEQKRAELKPAKEKWTKTITTTQSRKRAREKAGYADEDLAGSSEVVWKQKGSEAGSAACVPVFLMVRHDCIPVRWRDRGTTRPKAMSRLQQLFIRCHAVRQMNVPQ